MADFDSESGTEIMEMQKKYEGNIRMKRFRINLKSDLMEAMQLIYENIKILKIKMEYFLDYLIKVITKKIQKVLFFEKRFFKKKVKKIQHLFQC